MSTISFTITALAGAGANYSQIITPFNDGTNIHPLTETLTPAVLGTGYFTLIPYVDGNQAESNRQAVEYALSFNRDHANVGGTGNLIATVNLNVVTIISLVGTFENSYSYLGNVIGVAFTAPVNVPIPPDIFLTNTITSTGTCTVVEYDIEATGGAAPYSLERNGVEIQTGWDGVSQTIALARGEQHLLKAIDSNLDATNVVTENVPRKLVAAEFKERTVPFIGYSDLTIESVNPVANTEPINYSLDGVIYQASNVFPGIVQGTYTLYVRDVYGCEVTKTIVIYGFEDPTANQRIRKFIISEFNSLGFSKRNSNRKNYSNTLSCEENVALPKRAFFNFVSTDDINTQFKSSYPFHIITLFKNDGAKENLSFINIQENLGVSEKVDCKLFPVDGTTIGVYFDGGNEYEPNTTTVIDSSPYTNSLPSWGEIGQFVGFGTLGVKEVIGTGYDTALNKTYFTVEGTIAAAVDDTAQATYNRHDYDVFRCDFPMSKVGDIAFMRIEAGWAFDEIDQTIESETIKLLTDTTNYLKIQWSGFKNLGDMIFVDGYEGVMWVKGRVRPFSITESETYEGTIQTYALDETARLGQRVTIPILTPKQWHKFDYVSGITIGGTLVIEDMILVRTSAVESDEIGDTNVSNIEAEFAYAGESLFVAQAEIVLNPSTGVVGGGGTGKGRNETIYERVMLSDGTHTQLADGTYIALE